MKAKASKSFAPRNRNRSRALIKSLGVTLLLAGLGQVAHAGVLLDENFDDNAAIYTGIFAGEADASSINIRLGNNAINTNVNAGFDSFFGASPNRFLVIGDNRGAPNNLGGEPNGQDLGAVSIAMFDLGLLGAGLHSLGFSFDFAFDTNAGIRSTDDFFVALLDPFGNLIDELLRFDDVLRNEADRKGNFGQTVDIAMTSASNVYLAFGLFEYNDNSSSAVGIDNILVQSVPEPGSLALLSLGLLGLGFARRNKA